MEGGEDAVAALQVASPRGHIELAKILLNKGADANIFPEPK